MPDTTPDGTAEPSPDAGAVASGEAHVRTGDGTLIPDLSQAFCRWCGTVGSLRIEMRLHATPFGEFSLAGVGVKAPAIQWPWMVCDNCSESKGKREPTPSATSAPRMR